MDPSRVRLHLKKNFKSPVSRNVEGAAFHLPGELSVRRLTQANLSDRTFISKSIRLSPPCLDWER